MKQLKEIANEEFNVRSFKDRRKKVNRVTVSYIDDKGYEYRKSYEFDKTDSMDKMLRNIPHMFYAG